MMIMIIMMMMIMIMMVMMMIVVAMTMIMVVMMMMIMILTIMMILMMMMVMMVIMIVIERYSSTEDFILYAIDERYISIIDDNAISAISADSCLWLQQLFIDVVNFLITRGINIHHRNNSGTLNLRLNMSPLQLFISHINASYCETS